MTVFIRLQIPAFLSVLTLTSLLDAHQTVLPPPPPLPFGIPIPEQQLNLLLDDLTSGDKQTAEQSEQRLLRGGPTAIDALVDRLHRDPDDYYQIAPYLLERIFHHSDQEAALAAEQALVALAASEPQGVHTIAKSIVARLAVERRRRAVEMIRDLGARIEFSKDLFEVDDSSGILQPLIAHVLIDKHWTGGDAGLQQMIRLPSLRLMYLVDGHPLSEKAITRLQNALPKLRVESRGAVQLGISAAPRNVADIEGVTIALVAPGGAAHLAGLERSDVITAVDETPVRTYNELVEVLKQYSPGDVVQVKYLKLQERQLANRSVTLITKEQQTKLTLQGWRSEP